MKLLKTALCAAVASLALAGVANAAVVINAGAATEYVFRGLIQGSDAGFAGADWTQDGKTPQFYAGTWFSAVGFGPQAENDWYAGWTPSAGGVNFDFGAIYYGYWNDYEHYVNYKNGHFDKNVSAPYYEVKAVATLPIGMSSIKGSIFYSPNFFAETGAATYYEGAFSTPWKGMTFSGAVGEQTIAHVTPGNFACNSDKCSSSYTTWNFGVTIPVNEHFSVDARYIGSSSKAETFGNANLEEAGFNGIAATLKATLP